MLHSDAHPIRNHTNKMLLFALLHIWRPSLCMKQWQIVRHCAVFAYWQILLREIYILAVKISTKSTLPYTTVDEYYKNKK